MVTPGAVVVLAGGRGRRLGGVSKAELRLGEYSFLEWTLQALRELPREVPVVVVAPQSVPLPESSRALYQVLEDPPGSGPACGFYAGLQKVAELYREELIRGASPWVGLVPVDAPGAGRCLPKLGEYLAPFLPGAAGSEVGSAFSPQAVLAEAAGYRQNVIGLFHLAATLAAGHRLDLGSAHPRAAAMKALIGQLRWVSCPLSSPLLEDVDTPEQLRTLLQRKADWIKLFQDMGN